MPPDKKLTDKEKASLDEALKGAVLSDSELEKFAEGVDESGEVVMPVEDGEDLISAAAMALDFVEHLETSAPREVPGDEDVTYSVNMSIMAGGDVNPLNDEMTISLRSREQ